MAKKDPVPLTKDQIEEELLNDNLIDAGGVENENQLNSMSIEEKKVLLNGIRQSKEECSNQPSAQSSLSIDGFPSLPTPGKKESQNRLKLPRKTNTVSIGKVSEEKTLKTINLCDEDCVSVFSLPYCIPDGAPPLVSQRHLKSTKDPYYRLKHESDLDALKRMYSHHEQWKASYTTETSRIESQALGKDISYAEDIERESSKSCKFSEKENEPYTFVSDSPKNSPKLFAEQRKVEMRSDSGTLSHTNHQQGQRKTNRDSDCEEVEPILKNEEPKGNVSEWITENRPRSKRNRKQVYRDVRQEPEGSTNVEFDFKDKWDPSTGWQSPSAGGSSSALPLPPYNSPNQVEEEKVQCPICQKNFLISKVENHAATCEGFSDSPMDVEEQWPI